MSAITEFQSLLPRLSRAEKAQALQWLAREVGDAPAGVASVPGVCGGDPVVAGTRIAVWVLESLRRQGATDAELLNDYPTLTAQDLVNAWAYARGHPAEIDARIAEDERDDDDEVARGDGADPR